MTKQTAEGVKSCTSILELARKNDVDVPIIEQVDGDDPATTAPPRRSSQRCSSRPRKAETA